MADHRGGKPEAPGKPVLLLFDQALSGLESAAREKMTEMLADRARRGEDQQALLHDILKIVLLDPGGDQVGAGPQPGRSSRLASARGRVREQQCRRVDLLSRAVAADHSCFPC